ncbi:MAG: cell division protein ZapA [Candidatus Latescibacterota bacterium]|nr:cell division protein ZapA [Candidatus Latescibacterota bacterium]RKY67172.1 MAG: cell division protein ZapA [Candidatus Latescibacterota bacterium]
MSDKNNGKRTIVVNIFGTEYPIRGAEDDEYVQRAAMYVDAKMREVAVCSSLRSTTQVAVLAALNIVDELFKEQAKKGLAIEIDQKVARLTALLRNKIADVSA